MFLDQSNDPQHPRNKMKWHRIPDALHPVCKVFSIFCEMFNGSETTVTNFEPVKTRTVYDFAFFRLLEEPDGQWFFKAL
jgi:hypothetical protein